jgi:molybdopterin converting factor small subunit
MRVTVLLGGHLRDEAAKGPRERTMELDNSSRVQDLVELMGLPPERVRLILVNGQGATLATPLEDGYRVALFPPELSFNTFVSLSFRKERVEARQLGRAREGA